MLNWETLETACKACTKCALCQTRHNVVFGVGPHDAEVFFIGEGPGEQEDLRGEPFVGPAGKLLDDMLCIIDLGRENCYIGNIVKCRPPHNRDPLQTEQGRLHRMAARADAPSPPEDHRLPWPHRGDEAYPRGLQNFREHGQWEQKGGIWFTALYHPSALLRDETKRPETFRDLKSLQAKVREVCTHTL